MGFTVTSSDNISPRGGRSGRAIDFNQDGTLWLAMQDADGSSGTIRFYVSKNGGANWSQSLTSALADAATSSAPFNHSLAFFIDKDDFAHIVYVPESGDLAYRRGTPDEGRTAWTWSLPHTLVPSGGSNGFGNQEGLDIVAHREDDEWRVHVVTTMFAVTSTTRIYHWVVGITDAGGISTLDENELFDYGLTTDVGLSLDFRHTESDPKEVQSSTPSLYLALHDTAGLDLYFYKATYAAGDWTWGTQRALASGAGTLSHWLVSLVYDGTRVVIAHADSGTPTVVEVTERDEADTTTTARNPTALADGNVIQLQVAYGPNADIWLIAKGQTSVDYKKIRYNRGGASWGSWSVVQADTTDEGAAGVTLMRGMDISLSPLLGVAVEQDGVSPDNIVFDWLTAAWQGQANLQGVAGLSPSASLGIAAQAALQAVGSVSPTANLGLNPSALLQAVAELTPKGKLTPFQDFTVYDSYLDGLGLFGPEGLIYYEEGEARKTTVSQQLTPARTDVGDQPTEVRPERGEVFSQQDFSHGSGQLYYHRPDRDTKRYLWSEGFDVDIDTIGLPATLLHLNAVTQALSSTTAGKIEVFNDLPFVIDGTSIKVGSGTLPGFWTDDTPHASETPVTPQDIVSSGEFLYAALGANGIHRRTTAGVWSHWSDLQATRVAWLKNRIIAADGTSIYEVIAGGAAPTPIETLPAGWVFESIFEVSGFIYATAASRTAELSRIHAYKLNSAGTALEKKSETPFPHDQLLVSGNGYLDNVLIGGGIKNDLGGFDPVVYQAAVVDQDTGALSYSKIAEGEGAGGADLSVKSFESISENVVFGWSLGSGFSFGARDGLGILKLKVGGFFPYLKTDGAGEGRAVESVTLWKGVLLFTLRGKGVYFQDVSKVVRDAYLISSVADYQTTAKKVWDLAQVSHSRLPADTTVRMDITTRLPSDDDWTLAVTSDTDDAEITEARFDDLASRLLAVRIRSTSNSGQTVAPRGIGFLVRSNLLPDTAEWNLVRYIRLLKADKKDSGGENVYIDDVQATLRQIQALAYRIVKLYEPGVEWTVRVDRIADMTPFLPRYFETSGEERREGYILQLTLSGTRD